MIKALAVLSLALLLRGGVLFFTVDGGRIDYEARWSAQQYIIHHIDPFHPANVPPVLLSYAGEPYNMVDPPWFFAFGNLLYLPWKSLAPAWFIFINLMAVAILAWSIYTLSGQSPYCVAIVFANLGFGQQLINGNLGIFAVAGIAGSTVLLQRDRQLQAGLAMAVAQVKMTIAAPFFLLFALRRRWLALASAACVLSTATYWACLMTGISVAGLLQRMMDGANRYSTGGTSFWKALTFMGIPKTEALILSAVLFGGITIALAIRTSMDDISQLALFAVCARIFTYHNSIDNVVLCFLVLAAALTKHRALLAALVASLLVPDRIGDIPTVQIAFQLFWIVTLVVVMRARREPAPTQ